MVDTLSFASEIGTSDWVLILSTLTLAVAAFLTPLVGDMIKAKWLGPVLAMRPRMAQPTSHRTTLFIRLSPSQVQKHACHYFRLEVVNNGKSQAKKCEVIVEAVSKRSSTGAYVPYPRYTPVALTWGSGYDEFVDINPGRRFYCEFISVPDPEGQKTLLALGNYVDPPDEPPPALGAVLATRIAFNSQPNRLPQGQYRIALALFCENAPTLRTTVALTWTGQWQFDEDAMFRELVVATLGAT